METAQRAAIGTDPMIRSMDVERQVLVKFKAELEATSKRLDQERTALSLKEHEVTQRDVHLRSQVRLPVDTFHSIWIGSRIGGRKKTSGGKKSGYGCFA